MHGGKTPEQRFSHLTAGSFLSQGAQAGLSGIPAKYTEKPERFDLITEVADGLWHDCRIGGDGSKVEPVSEHKYHHGACVKRP